MLFKNSVRTSKRTPHFTVTKINWLILFKEIIVVYSENHIKTYKFALSAKCRVTEFYDTWYVCFEGFDSVVK
jgi:hypothetical protein